MQPRKRPTLLDGLTLTETSVCAKGANPHAGILFWKRDAAAAAGTANPQPLGDRLAKLEADIASTRANRRVDELYDAMAKGDTARGRELLRDTETYEAYRARMAGERYVAPVRVTKAEPDHRGEIRKLLAAGDTDGLTRLFRSAPAAHGQYRELLMAGGLVAAAAEGIAKRSRTPAQVPAAEVARWRERIRALLKARDPKGMEVARRQGGAGFEAAWIAMATAGERMTM